jgi:hypothetical protein
MTAKTVSTDQAVSEGWRDYFRYNRDHLMNICWDDDYTLTAEEARTITRSLQQFQLGESSEGKHVLALARHYAERSGDTEFVPALTLFIQEEQRHSRYLGRFMELQGIALVQADPVDSVFRIIRKMATLEIAVIAMITAEVIAFPYYKALHDATASSLLRQICAQLLRDEVQHLRFQTDTLHKLRCNRSALGLALTHLFQRALFGGTMLIVWHGHRPVLKAGGHSLRTFWAAGWQRFHKTTDGDQPVTGTARKERAI